MSTALISDPLRTSLSMIDGHEAPLDLPPDSEFRPLGYLYATWDPGTPDEAGTEIGYYDPGSQTWIDPGGFITAGVYTKTKTSGCPGDCVTDDVCA